MKEKRPEACVAPGQDHRRLPAEPLAGAACVLASYLAGRQETDAQQTAQLLADALERQAKLLRFS